MAKPYIQILSERPPDFWSNQYFPKPLRMEQHTITTLDEQVIYDLKSFYQWAEHQDCTLNTGASPSLGIKDFDITVGPLVGKIIFAARPDRWENTREFWIPIGMVQKVVQDHHHRMTLVCNRQELVAWMVEHPQTRRLDPKDPKSQRVQTGYKAFQVLRVRFDHCTEGYLYRASSSAESYQVFPTEAYWARIAERNRGRFTQERGHYKP